ncbi:protein PIGBOS1 isoform X1 [Sarcophilus harrisii]|uniref:protein PIGBOS1 isoform X1 n=1 Tax=Sarcophilus harrisii TaxID=9305 RepID=UPI001301CE66|nr:protein PIGBOS1 isoform X1 [Sarcophilus harrisii]
MDANQVEKVWGLMEARPQAEDSPLWKALGSKGCRLVPHGTDCFRNSRGESGRKMREDQFSAGEGEDAGGSWGIVSLLRSRLCLGQRAVNPRAWLRTLRRFEDTSWIITNNF